MLYQKYSEEGFEIFAFPCNQFASQEPGTHEEIEKFIREKYECSFPIFEKIEVNGPNTHPVFNYLRRNSPLYDDKSDSVKNIPWNFAKFLVNSEGKVVKYVEPQVDPEKMEEDIKSLLA